MISINKFNNIKNESINSFLSKCVYKININNKLYSQTFPKIKINNINFEIKKINYLKNNEGIKISKSYYSEKIKGKENFNFNSSKNEKTEEENKSNQDSENNNKYSIVVGLTTISLAGIIKVHRKLIENQIDEIENKNQIKIEGSPIMKFYSVLPWRILSRFTGKLMNLTIPVKYRAKLIRFYARKFNCNLDEILNEDLESYPSIASFFYRDIKSDSRPIDEKAELISPVDGRVLKFGEIVDNKIEQVKGLTYSVNSLLGYQNNEKNYKEDDIDINDEKMSIAINRKEKNKLMEEKKFCKNYKIDSVNELNKKNNNNKNTSEISVKKGNKLFYCVMYLSPGDYHQFHSPTNWVIEKRRHFTGHLLSVSPKICNSIHNLFTVNERVALIGRWKYGFFSMIPVGATNVGSIKLNIDEDLTTNLPFRKVPVKRGNYTERSFSNNSKLLNGIKIYSGEKLGGFKMGSTVVLVFEAPKDYKFKLNLNQKVMMGQPI